MQRVDYFVDLLSRLVRQLTISLYTFLCMTSISWDHEEMRKFSENGSFSVPTGEIPDSNMVL